MPVPAPAPLTQVGVVVRDIWASMKLYHELLEHRWFLSEQAGRDVGRDEALDSYVERLRSMPDERRAIVGLRNTGDISNEVMHRLERELDLEESYLDQ